MFFMWISLECTFRWYIESDEVYKSSSSGVRDKRTKNMKNVLRHQQKLRKKNFLNEITFLFKNLVHAQPSYFCRKIAFCLYQWNWKVSSKFISPWLIGTNIEIVFKYSHSCIAIFQWPKLQHFKVPYTQCIWNWYEENFYEMYLLTNGTNMWWNVNWFSHPPISGKNHLKTPKCNQT